MKKTWILSALLTLGPVCWAQQADKFPLGEYEELTDTKPHDDAEVWDRMPAATELSWGTTDIRYKKLDVPDVKKSTRWKTKAWKGERVNAQAVLWTKTDLEDATITVSELKNGSAVIPASAVTTNFVRYVMTDELNKDRKGGCGHRENKAEWDSSIVADALDIVKLRDVKARTTQPIWLQVWVPSDARTGKYKGTLTVSGKNFEAKELQFEIQVLNRTLTDEEIYEFAQVISTVKNKRFFDARLRLIDEVTAVDSFLVQSGALATNGASYFTTLYDYWMYGDLFERKSGTEISGGITPGFEFAKDEEAIAYDCKRLSPAIVADVRLDYEKPMNLYWQNSAMVRLYGGYEYLYYDYESGVGMESKLNNYNANLNARYGFGYYPNSRTNINLGVEELLSWNKLANKDADLGSDSYVGTHTSLYLDLYYYFSPQLRLAAEGNLGYRYSERDSYNGWTGNFVLTLTYSLF